MPALRGPFPAQRMLGVLLCLDLLGGVAHAQDAPLEATHTARGRVDVAYAANGLVSCDNQDPNCRGVRAGVVQLQNTQLEMRFIDVDPLALGDLDRDGRDDTVNASAAQLELPEGARIEYARLYVGGIWRADNPDLCGPSRAVPEADRTAVLFAPPGTGAYLPLRGELLGDDDQAVGSGYAAVFDVTAHIAGPGEVWVADAALIEGRCAAGGWALAVAIRTDDGPPRSIVLLSGYTRVEGVDVEVPIDGLLAPSAGPVTATVALGAVEGDRGLDDDDAMLADQPLTDALNPIDDVFNSTISRAGQNVVARTPAHLNNLSFDFDIFDASGLIAPDARETSVLLGADRDFIKAFFVGLAVDLAMPRLTMGKSVELLDGAPGDQAQPGDRLQYTVTLSADAANREPIIEAAISDPLPTEVDWVADSLEVQRPGEAFEPATDVADDDGIDYDRAAHQVNAQLLAPLAAGETWRARFEVVVLPSARREIANSATVSWSGEAAGADVVLEGRSDDDPELPGEQPTTIAVAPAPDMGPDPDMAFDAGVTDARVEGDGPPIPGVDRGPIEGDMQPGDMPDISSADASTGDAIPPDATRRDATLLVDGEDVAGGLVFGCDATNAGHGPGSWGLIGLLLLALRRRLIGGVALALGGFALVALTGSAEAGERFDVQQFTPAADGRNHGLRLLSAHPNPGPGWSAGLLIDHADDPLVVEIDGERTRSLVARQTRAHLMASGALTKALDVGVVVPVMLDAAGDGAVGGPGMGDIRVQGRWVLWQPEDAPDSALAVAVDGFLGTGDIDAFHGDHNRRVEARVLASKRLASGVDLRGNLGWLFRDGARLGNLEVNDALTVGLGAAIPLGDTLALLPEVHAALGIADELDTVELPVEALLGARWSPDPVWSATAGFGTALAPGAGAPDWRLVLGFTFTRAVPDQLPPRAGSVEAASR